MTASTPTSLRSAPGSYMVGMPPPPAQITIVPCSSSHLIGRISKMRFGRGDGTTRRHLSPSCLKTQPFSAASRSASAFVVDRADELGRDSEAGIVAVDLDHGEQGREGHLEREQVAELLLDHVADHALRLGAEHVERIGLVGLVGGALQREQPDLRAVAVGDHELMLGGERRQRLRGDADVRALHLGGHRLAAPQQRVPAERDDDAHGVSLPAWRRAAP